VKLNCKCSIFEKQILGERSPEDFSHILVFLYHLFPLVLHLLNRVAHYFDALLERSFLSDIWVRGTIPCAHMFGQLLFWSALPILFLKVQITILPNFTVRLDATVLA